MGEKMQKTYVSINSLSSTDRIKLKNVIMELNDSFTRVSAESDLQKEILDTIAGDLGVDKKIVRRMAKVYFNSSFNNEVEDNRIFEEFYTIILNQNTSSLVIKD